MKFLRVGTLLDGTEPLRDRLIRDLEHNKRLLWLVPGGSNIPLTVSVMGQLPDDLTAKLTIMLTDERYGAVGHADSNAQQLDNAGFWPKQACVIPVLQEGLDIFETTKQYESNFQHVANKADVIIGQFGMGADGHIAGLLPGSPAVSSAGYAASYHTGQYDRITLTPKALLRLTCAYVFALGNEKHAAINALGTRETDIAEQPAQLLKQLPEAYIYNDQLNTDD